MDFVNFLLVLAITAFTGYSAGFMTVKINNLLVITLGKLWSSGHAKKRYIPVGFALTFYYIVVILAMFNFVTAVEPVIFVAVFSCLYSAGIYHADKRFSESILIMNQIIKITYATGDSSEEVKIRECTQKNALSILSSMPESNRHALELLFFTFDSAFMVFFISMITGRLRSGRFIDLEYPEQEEYFQTWADNSYLFYAVSALKSFIGFSYYSCPGTWDNIGYNGKALVGSYLR